MSKQSIHRERNFKRVAASQHIRCTSMLEIRMERVYQERSKLGSIQAPNQRTTNSKAMIPPQFLVHAWSQTDRRGGACSPPSPSSSMRKIVPTPTSLCRLRPRRLVATTLRSSPPLLRHRRLHTTAVPLRLRLTSERVPAEPQACGAHTLEARTRCVSLLA